MCGGVSLPGPAPNGPTPPGRPVTDTRPAQRRPESLAPRLTRTPAAERGCQMRVSGLEPETYGLKVRDSSDERSDRETSCSSDSGEVAPKVALGIADSACERLTTGEKAEARIEPNDPALARVVKAWQALPEHVRSTILTLVEAASAS